MDWAGADENKMPIVGVKVSIDGLSDITGDDGRYVIRDLSDGVKTVRVERMNKEIYKTAISIEGDDEIKTVDIVVLPQTPTPTLLVDANKELVNVYGTRWIGGVNYAILNGERIPSARILQSNESVTTFLGDACAIQFDLEASEGVDWLVIDEIFVKVVQYIPLPKVELVLFLPFEESNVYFVEIDDPSSAGTEIFKSECIYYKNDTKSYGVVRLKEKIPENVVIRINAKKTGIYVFDVGFVVRSKDYKETIWVYKEAKWVFYDDSTRREYWER